MPGKGCYIVSNWGCFQGLVEEVEDAFHVTVLSARVRDGVKDVDEQ